MYNEENPLSISFEAGKILIFKQAHNKIFVKFNKNLINIFNFELFIFKIRENFQPISARFGQ